MRMSPNTAPWLFAGLFLGLCTACTRTPGQWTQDLDSNDPFVRGMAAIALGIENPRGARPALPILLRAIDRSDVGLEAQAARVLVHVGPHHVDFLLAALVKSELMSDDQRGTIKNALVKAGPPAAKQVVNCMRGPGKHLVGHLGEVLLSIGPESLPAMIALLERGNDPRLRSYGAFLIANFGPRARSALPLLQDALDEEDPDLRAIAFQAIESLHGRPWKAPQPMAKGQ